MTGPLLSLKLSAVAMGCLALLGGQAARAQALSGPLVVVIHIDALPDDAGTTLNLLTQLRRDSAHEAGEKDFQVLQEIGRPNHFTLVETWADEKDFDAHNAAEHTRRFREQIQPMLGSPFDERLHTVTSDRGR